MNTVYSKFREIVKKYPDFPAIKENERTLTFSELSALVDRICSRFGAPLKNIGIVMRHNAEMIAAMFAVLKCGGCYVPAEPNFPIGRINEMFGEAEIDFIITQKEFAEKLNGYKLFIIDDIDRETGAGECPRAGVTPETPAYILYTSGTTGKPKGVCVTNGNICYYARAFDNEFKPLPGDVMLQYSVCTFDIFVEEVFAAMLNGAAIAIPNEEQKADIKELIKFIDAKNVKIISGFPYLFEEINKNGEFPDSLGLFLSGGDVLRASYIDKVPSRIQVYNTYGPSETTVCAAYYNCIDGALEDGAYPIGQAVLGAEIRIIGKDGKDVKKGQVGEIAISGEGVSLGYIGGRREENGAFVTAEDGKRVYKTGDLGYELKNGDIAFLHRKDTQVMIKGKRVETAEVQSRLYEIKDIRQAFVRALTDENGLAYMTAYIVPSENAELKLKEIRAELSKHLPDYMIPEFFVELSEITKNENGKPDISKLPVVMK